MDPVQKRRPSSRGQCGRPPNTATVGHTRSHRRTDADPPVGPRRHAERPSPQRRLRGAGDGDATPPARRLNAARGSRERRGVGALDGRFRGPRARPAPRAPAGPAALARRGSGNRPRDRSEYVGAASAGVDGPTGRRAPSRSWAWGEGSRTRGRSAAALRRAADSLGAAPPSSLARPGPRGPSRPAGCGVGVGSRGRGRRGRAERPGPRSSGLPAPRRSVGVRSRSPRTSLPPEARRGASGALKARPRAGGTAAAAAAKRTAGLSPWYLLSKLFTDDCGHE